MPAHSASFWDVRIRLAGTKMYPPGTESGSCVGPLISSAMAVKVYDMPGVGQLRGELPANLLHETANLDAIEGSCPLPHFPGQLGAERGFLLPAVKVHSLADLPFLRTHSQGAQQHDG